MVKVTTETLGRENHCKLSAHHSVSMDNYSAGLIWDYNAVAYCRCCVI